MKITTMKEMTTAIRPMWLAYGNSSASQTESSMSVQPHPMTLAAQWLHEAVHAGVAQPEAMCVATATPAGAPSARMVLLRGIDERGAVFYSNSESRKGRELAANPRAAGVLFWEPLGRQVRFEGRVEPVSEEESDAYFASRPRPSAIGAWASDQSRPIASRDALLARYAETVERFGEGPIPRPPHWHGYRIVPDAVELWEHGAH